MADERRIVIELIATNKNDGNSSKKDNDDEDDLTSLLKGIQHPVKTVEKATFGKNIVMYQAWQQAKSLVKNAAMYTIGRYFNLTENYKGEQDLQNTISVIENVASLGTAIISGAIVGAKAGPVGAVAGAAAGFVFGAANVGLNAIKAWESQNIQIATMNIESSFQKVRLGLVDNGRGTQN